MLREVACLFGSAERCWAGQDLEKRKILIYSDYSEFVMFLLWLAPPGRIAHGTRGCAGSLRPTGPSYRPPARPGQFGGSAGYEILLAPKPLSVCLASGFGHRTVHLSPQEAGWPGAEQGGVCRAA